MTNQEAIPIIKNVNAKNNCITCYYMHDITCEEYQYCRVEKALKMAIEALENQKTGHWIEHPKGIYAHLVCDKCLSNAPYDCQTNYCPNCGAKMEGE